MEIARAKYNTLAYLGANGAHMFALRVLLALDFLNTTSSVMLIVEITKHKVFFNVDSIGIFFCNLRKKWVNIYRHYLMKNTVIIVQ